MAAIASASIVDPGVEPVDLGEQHRGGVGRVAGTDVVLDRPGDPLVHHLHGSGDDAGGDDGADRVGRIAHVVERQQHRSHRRRALGESHGDPRGDAQRALAADEHATQVEPERLGVEAAEHGDLAVGQHDLDRLHVGVGHAVGEAVRPAGVVGHVAADGAHLLARRIGREVETEGRKVFGEVEVDDARLDPGDAVVEVDVEDPIHPRQRHDDRRPERDRTAGEARAGAAWHDRAPVPCRDPHDRLHLGGRRREAHRSRHTTAEDRRVVAQQRALGRVDAHAVVADRGA